MNGIGLETIGLALVGLSVGLAIGWMMAMRRSRLHQSDMEQEATRRIQQANAEKNAHSSSLRRARHRLQELEELVDDLETNLAGRNQKVARLQTQVIDRESTIDSLRSRLYGARISANLLEEELESLQHQFRTIDTAVASTSRTESSTSSLTISLGDGLEIETAPTESKTIGGI